MYHPNGSSNAIFLCCALLHGLDLDIVRLEFCICWVRLKFARVCAMDGHGWMKVASGSSGAAMPGDAGGSASTTTVAPGSSSFSKLVEARARALMASGPRGSGSVEALPPREPHQAPQADK